MNTYQKDREATRTPKRFKEDEKQKGEIRRNNGHHIERETERLSLSGFHIKISRTCTGCEYVKCGHCDAT